jgi:class 3 adenylate cyclase
MATCPNCDSRLVQGAKFCPQCGHRLGSGLSAQEFRIVTVVFCDVVKSTDLERRLQPLPMQRLLDRYGKAVRTVLGGHGASVGKRHGDGFMAAFGVPDLHEDDALRAVRAAAELRGALDELADDPLERGLEIAGDLARLPSGAYETVKRQLRGPTLVEMERMLAAYPMAGGWLSAETGDAAASILRRD